MTELSLGEELIASIEDALESKESGRTVRPDVDVAKIRKNLKLSQRQFANRYHFNLETLRNWEQHKRYPDTSSLAYLTCIAKQPQIIHDLLN